MKRWIPIISFIVLLGALIGWRLTQKQAQAAADKKAGVAMRSASALVETIAAKRQDVVKTFEAIANVEASLAVDISPELSARIVMLDVREGDRVTAGQVIVRLDPLEVQTGLRREQAALAQSRARLAEASLTENAQSVNVSSAVRQQQAALKTAQAQERQARADFDAQIATAEANVTAAEGRLNSAQAAISGADAAITSAEANLENARTSLARQEALLEKGFVAKQVVDNASTTVKVREADVGKAKEDRKAAVADRDSALAQKQAAERQVQVVRNKARADVDAATAAVSQAQATLDSARANTARTSAYTQNLAALQAAVAASEANVRTANAKIADTILHSPLDGIVTRRLKDPGALVSINQPILSVQAVDQVWATVSLPEEVSRRLYAGQTATVTFDALPGERFNGSIFQILPSADIQSRQFTARVRLDNRNRRIKPGMFGRVLFITEQEKKVLTVPLEAVKTDPAKPGVSTVMVIADGAAQTREVKTGLANGKVIAIRDGLKDGEQVILRSASGIKEGQKVRTGKDKKDGDKKPDEKGAGATAKEGSARG